jgi:hypothetical protein
MAMKINNLFSIGQTVYITSDPDQLERKVLYITINPGNQLLYGIRFDGEIFDYWETELSADKKY